MDIKINVRYSEKNYRFGRRRVFVTLGAAIAVVGLICFANPQWLAELIQQDGNQTIMIVFALISLWVLNIGLNMMQGPGWALVLDLCPGTQQKTGNAIVSALSAFSGILTNLLGFVDIVKYLPFFEDNAHALLYIGVLVIIITLVPTLLAASEKKYVPPATLDGQKGPSFMKELQVPDYNG